MTTMATVPDADAIERVLINGDLAALTEAQRLSYYRRVCESLGLNPLTQPFDYLRLSGKLVLYATKNCTEQLRKLHLVSITDLRTERVGDVYISTVHARDKSLRTDCATGVVAVGNLKGDALANAVMKAETKAKRRVTLSLCGLGMLDESELETVPEAITGAPALLATTDVVEPVPTPAPAPKRGKPPAGFEPWMKALGLAADRGEAALRAFWGAGDPKMKRYLLEHDDGATWMAMKGRAAQADAEARQSREDR